ncbi:MAG: hypothetical protein HMLIMOIP_001857 [Candidatus Nitrosomirales archaeon]|jgi:hypothetical protein
MYVLSAALAAAVVILGIISVSAIQELKASRDSISNDSSPELSTLSHEISQLRSTMASASGQALSLNPDEKTITVGGIASTTIQHDKIFISLGVDTRADTAQEAVRLNAEKMENITKAIRDLGIKENEIRTQYFNLGTNYDYKRNELPTVIGFAATNTIAVFTAVSNVTAGKIIDTAVEAGTTRVNDAYFAVSPELGAKLWEQIVANAVLDARLKAEKILEPLDMKIVGIKNISPYDTGYPIYRGTILGATGQEPLAPPLTPFYQGQQEFSVSVSVTFLIA